MKLVRDRPNSGNDHIGRTSPLVCLTGIIWLLLDFQAKVNLLGFMMCRLKLSDFGF